MKTAGRENQNRWGTVSGNRAYGTAGQSRSHLISWAAKQGKIQPAWISFFLTSAFIELTGHLDPSTHFSGNRVYQALTLAPRELGFSC